MLKQRHLNFNLAMCVLMVHVEKERQMTRSL